MYSFQTRSVPVSQLPNYLCKNLFSLTVLKALLILWCFSAIDLGFDQSEKINVNFSCFIPSTLWSLLSLSLYSRYKQILATQFLFFQFDFFQNSSVFGFGTKMRIITMWSPFACRLKTPTLDQKQFQLTETAFPSKWK